jgi:phosphopentomutase
MLEEVIASGRKVYATGKIDDLFGHRGISVSNHTTNNRDSTLAMIQFLREDFEGMLIANLIEFDMIFGHRNDVSGYAGALEAFDQFMPEIVANLNNDDVAMIVADHGVDPTTTSTDHSRE